MKLSLRQLKNQNGSLMLEALSGIAISAIVIMIPLPMYLNSYSNLNKFAQVDSSLQISKQLLNDYRVMLPGNPEKDEGDHTRYYSPEGLILGKNIGTMTPEQVSKIFYTTKTTISDSTKIINLGESGETSTILLKNLKIQVSWVRDNKGTSDPQDDEVRSVELSSVLEGD